MAVNQPVTIELNNFEKNSPAHLGVPLAVAGEREA
jgi:hypothetical protein